MNLYPQSSTLESLWKWHTKLVTFSNTKGSRPSHPGQFWLPSLPEYL